MKIILPPLNSLRAFESAARHESFTSAAGELAVTHGAISRQVALLEEHLGTLLFERGHRQVRLTRAGSALRDEVTASLLRIAAATARVRDRNDPSQRVRVSAPPAFSVRWLIPHLSVFQKDRPAIEVSLSSSVAPPDFGSGLYDLAIRRLDRAPRRIHAKPLFAEHSIPVVHAGLNLATSDTGSKTRSASLSARAHALLRHVRLIRVAGEPRGWAAWANRWGVNLDSARYLDVEQTYLAMQAVLEGLGIALLPYSLIMDDFDNGILEAPLGHCRIDDSRYFLTSAYPPRRGGALAHLVEHLVNEGRQISKRTEADPVVSP